MSDTPKKYRLDRTAFIPRNASEQVNYGKEHQKLTWQERIIHVVSILDTHRTSGIF